jgi:cell division transport system permease protein
LKENVNHENFVKELESLDGVRKVKYSKIAAEGITKMNVLGAYVAGALILILLLVSVFLVSNTVSLGVSVRGEEIAIMKLIGAANGFIKAPFRMEGMMIGLTGSAIPMIVIYFGYDRIIRWMTERFHVVTVFMKFVPVREIMIYLIPMAFFVGLLIGCIGSTITIRKYLKV